MELFLRHVIPDSDDYRYVSKLYSLSFPESERIRIEDIIKVSENTQLGELSVVVDGETRIGMLYLLFNKDLVYIFYLATDPGVRGRGYGSAILSLVKESYPDHRFSLGCEEPDENADDNEMRLRRKRFYERNGFSDTGRRAHWQGVTYAMMAIGQTGRFEVGRMMRRHFKYSKRYRRPKSAGTFRPRPERLRPASCPRPPVFLYRMPYSHLCRKKRPWSANTWCATSRLSTPI